jgi:DDE domain
VINVDQNPAYPKALEELKAAGKLSQGCQLRPAKYLNNIIEQDHRFIKRLVQSRAGVLLFPNGLANLEGLRDDAYDPEGTSASRWNPGPSQVRRQPIGARCLTLPKPRLQ